jgi:PPOX class probable F420-dependent enzyme
VVVRLATDEARERFATARVARLATVGDDGAPHLVPVVFAVIDERIVHVVDSKPKATDDPWRLTRVRNLLREPHVAFLADAYDEDWSALWWVRADALARVLERATDASEWDRAVDALAERYPPYRSVRPTGPVITARVTRWTGWSAS